MPICDVLIIVAHPDDESLGMAGTIRKLCESGSKVGIVCVTDGFASMTGATCRNTTHQRICALLGVEYTEYIDLIDQRLDVYSQLELTHRLTSIINKTQPNIVYTHCVEDLNKDHRIVHDSVMVACRPNRSCVKELYTFKVTDVDFGEYGSFVPNTFVDITEYKSIREYCISLYDMADKGCNIKSIGDKYYETFKQVFRIV